MIILYPLDFDSYPCRLDGDGESFIGLYFHIGVGSSVVCSTVSGNAKASISGTGNSQFPRLSCLANHIYKQCCSLGTGHEKITVMIHTKKILSTVLYHCFFIAMVIGVCFVSVACDSHRDAVADLVELRDDVKAHGASFDEEQWNDAIERYNEIDEQLQQMQLTEKERDEVYRIKGEIAGCIASAIAEEATEGLRELTEGLESFADGFSETFEMPDIEE